MSIIARIPINPNGVRVRYPVARFIAPFGGGQYDFNQPFNTNQLLIPLENNSIYLIERINFYANVSEVAWLESAGAELPFFRLRFQNNPSNSIFPEPVRCGNYIANGEQLVFFRNTRKDDDLLITFGGIINQVAATVGVDPILAQVNFTIYQIINEKWAKQFIDPEHYAELGL